MKNPLYYVDYWYDLIKFGFDRKHTFITLIVVCVSFIAPILLLIAYQSAPSRKNIEDPFVFVGTISEFHKPAAIYPCEEAVKFLICISEIARRIMNNSVCNFVI